MTIVEAWTRFYTAAMTRGNRADQAATEADRGVSVLIDRFKINEVTAELIPHMPAVILNQKVAASFAVSTRAEQALFRLVGRVSKLLGVDLTMAPELDPVPEISARIERRIGDLLLVQTRLEACDALASVNDVRRREAERGASIEAAHDEMGLDANATLDTDIPF